MDPFGWTLDHLKVTIGILNSTKTQKRGDLLYLDWQLLQTTWVFFQTTGLVVGTRASKFP